MKSKSRRSFLAGIGSLGIGASLPTGSQVSYRVPFLTDGQTDRQYWVQILTRLVEPVLRNLARGTLKQNMPTEGPRSSYAHLEAFGRLLTGLAPWLELANDGTEEGQRRESMAELTRGALDMAVDPSSPDFLNFNQGNQPLVDAAFLAQAVLRAPVQLWQNSPGNVRQNLVAALLSTRTITPNSSNWLLFSAMIEAAFYKLGLEWDHLRVELVIQELESWYLGDGNYGDGPQHRWDYYNSFVIQPFLIDILESFQIHSQRMRQRYERTRRIASRYAAVQERLISPEATYPPIGRSLVYRFGAFQLLSQMALKNSLPPEISPAQVRSALTAVIRRQMSAPQTFDKDGWLNTGFCGHQPELAEGYISRGSGYLCAAGLVALGLPALHPFWVGPGEDWTARKVWSGQDLPPDHALRV